MEKQLFVGEFTMNSVLSNLLFKSHLLLSKTELKNSKPDNRYWTSLFPRQNRIPQSFSNKMGHVHAGIFPLN
jgi:hypothetical protein